MIKMSPIKEEPGQVVYSQGKRVYLQDGAAA